jgi:hypothetical protein
MGYKASHRSMPNQLNATFSSGLIVDMLKVMQKGNRNFSAYKVEVSRQESIGLQ